MYKKASYFVNGRPGRWWSPESNVRGYDDMGSNDPEATRRNRKKRFRWKYKFNLKSPKQEEKERLLKICLGKK